MRYLVRVYRDTTTDICDEFEDLKEAEEFAKLYKKYAIFELLYRNESDMEENL